MRGHIAVCHGLRTPKPVPDALVLYLVSFVFLLLLQSVPAAVHKRDIKRHGFYNVGEATYELGDKSLRFTGTTFNCDIPYDSMTSVIRYSGNAAILFTRLSGFLLPAEDTIVEGDWASFISELEKKLATQPSSSTDAAIKGDGGEDGQE